MKRTRTALTLLGASLSATLVLSACGSNGAGPAGSDDANMAGASGTGGSTNTGGTTSMAGAAGSSGDSESCEPAATECATDRAMQTCRNDGEGWVVTACEPGEFCTDGKCALGGICSPGHTVCTDAQTRVTCLPDGSGYEEVTCPDTAPCVDGQCVGPVCTVGDSKCDDTTLNVYANLYGYADSATLWTCEDGTAWVRSACGAGEACSFDNVRGEVDFAEIARFFEGDNSTALPDFPEIPEHPRASCKEPECSITQQSFFFEGDFACGNPSDESISATDNYSQCKGFLPFQNPHWETAACAEYETCDPNRLPAIPCSSECTPGQTACYGSRGIRTCQEDGTWGDVVACSSTGDGDYCGQSYTASNVYEAQCGDNVCLNYWSNYFEGNPSGEFGTCDASGQIRLCGPDGQLGEPQSCSEGTCQVRTTSTYDGYRPGLCETECQDGQQYCIGGNQYRTCVGGTWEVSACDAGMACQGSGDSLTCGCEEGDTRCSGGAIQTCGANGQYGPSEECTFGSCNSSNGIALCVAECVPGEFECRSNSTEERVCDENGRWAAYASCDEGTECKRDNTGRHLGCVECVGSGTVYYGVPDSRCSNGELQTCQPDNTWGEPVACSATQACKQSSSSGSNYNESRSAVCQEQPEQPAD